MFGAEGAQISYLRIRRFDSIFEFFSSLLEPSVRSMTRENVAALYPRFGPTSIRSLANDPSKRNSHVSSRAYARH